ncbi:MAG: tetratricopeptide repeat protein [Verrucomicrobiia bacterium]
MTIRLSMGAALAALLGSLVMTGCASHASRSGAKASANGLFSTPDAEPESDAALEQRIQTLAHFATGLSHDLNARPDLAREELVQAAQLDPSFEPIVVDAARRCLLAQQPDRAIRLLLDAAEKPDASGALFAWLGLAYAQAGKTELAIAANRTAINRMPDAFPAYQNLVQLYLNTGRTNDVRAVLNEAAEQDAEDPGFYIDVADLYARHTPVKGGEGERITARVKELLDRAAALKPANPVHVLRLAENYFALGELQKAEPFYRELLQDHGDLPTLRAKLTEIYLRSGDKEKASQQLEAIAQSEPTNPQTFLFLGALAVEGQDYTNAIDHFERALRLDPDLEEVYYDLAGLHISTKKPQLALSVMERARARFKLSFPMELYTGLAYASAKNYPEALKFLTSAEAVARATDAKRLNQSFYFQMGATLERAGRIDDAEKYFRECLKLAPENAEALNYLGYMWADKGTNLTEAHELIDKAVRLEPENAAFLDSLAWVLHKLDRPQEALAPMLKAIEKSEKPDPTLYDHLGDIYAALKRFDDAREAWSQALKVEPDPDEPVDSALLEGIQRKLNAAPAVSHSAP